MSKRIEVNVPKQTPGYCGPGALAIALSALGVEKSEQELATLAATNGSEEARVGGTEHEGMIAAAKALGLHTYVKEEGTIADLEAFIEKGVPVIVGWFDTDDDHYSVAVEITGTEVVLADSSILGPERRISRELFPHIWFDFVGQGNHEVSWGWMMVLSKDPITSASH